MATPDNGLIKGQGLVLITGKKGAGKSHFATAQIKYIRDNFPDHPVYADIAGISIEGVEKSPDDWQTLLNEDGIANATVFYDEAQLLEWADNSNTKISSDSRIKNMTMIRHANLNIVIMTQDPTFVHAALRKLVDVHYHISHPFKDGKPKVFKFVGAMSTIDDKGAYKTYAVESFTHKLDKETSALYKSVEDGATHDQKRKIPKRIIYMGLFIAVLLLFAVPAAIYGIGKAYSFIGGAKDRGNEMVNEANNVAGGAAANNVKGASGFNDPSMVNPEQLSKEQLDALYKKYLDEYTVEVGQHDLVRPDSIMASNGKCMAYNMYGDGLNISYDKCMDMLNNPETRPHKRAARQEMNNNASASVQAPKAEESQQDFINNPPPPLPNS